jgi:hypothetical protein
LHGVAHSSEPNKPVECLVCEQAWTLEHRALRQAVAENTQGAHITVKRQLYRIALLREDLPVRPPVRPSVVQYTAITRTDAPALTPEVWGAEDTAFRVIYCLGKA